MFLGLGQMFQCRAIQRIGKRSVQTAALAIANWANVLVSQALLVRLATEIYVPTTVVAMVFACP